MKHSLNITLSPDLGGFVEERVRYGQYPSVTDVVSGALEALRTCERLTNNDLAELREEIGVGIRRLPRDSGRHRIIARAARGTSSALTISA